MATRGQIPPLASVKDKQRDNLTGGPRPFGERGVQIYWNEEWAGEGNLELRIGEISLPLSARPASLPQSTKAAKLEWWDKMEGMAQHLRGDRFTERVGVKGSVKLVGDQTAYAGECERAVWAKRIEPTGVLEWG